MLNHRHDPRKYEVSLLRKGVTLVLNANCSKALFFTLLSPSLLFWSILVLSKFSVVAVVVVAIVIVVAVIGVVVVVVVFVVVIVVVVVERPQVYPQW